MSLKGSPGVWPALVHLQTPDTDSALTQLSPAAGSITCVRVCAFVCTASCTWIILVLPPSLLPLHSPASCRQVTGWRRKHSGKGTVVQGKVSVAGCAGDRVWRGGGQGRGQARRRWIRVVSVTSLRGMMRRAR